MSDIDEILSEYLSREQEPPEPEPAPPETGYNPPQSVAPAADLVVPAYRSEQKLGAVAPQPVRQEPLSAVGAQSHSFEGLSMQSPGTVDMAHLQMPQGRSVQGRETDHEDMTHSPWFIDNRQTMEIASQSSTDQDMESHLLLLAYKDSYS